MTREYTPEQIKDLTSPPPLRSTVHYRDPDSEVCRSAAVTATDASTMLGLVVFRPRGAEPVNARRHVFLNSWGGWHHYWECETPGKE